MAQYSPWDMPFTEEEETQIREYPFMQTTFKIQQEFLKFLSMDPSKGQVEQFWCFISETYDPEWKTRNSKQSKIGVAEFVGRRGISGLGSQYIGKALKEAGKNSLLDDFRAHPYTFLVISRVRGHFMDFCLLDRSVALTLMSTSLPADLVEELRHTARIVKETANPKHFTAIFGLPFVHDYLDQKRPAVSRIGILHNLAMVEENVPKLLQLGFPEVMTEVLKTQSDEFRGYATMCISQVASMVPHLLDKPDTEGIMWMNKVLENGLLSNYHATDAAGSGPVCRAFRGLALSERNRKIIVARNIVPTIVKLFRIVDDQACMRDKTWIAQTLRNLTASPSARKAMIAEGLVMSLREAVTGSGAEEMRTAAAEALKALSVDGFGDDTEREVKVELPHTIWDIKKTYDWLLEYGIEPSEGSSLRGKDLSDLYQKKKENPASFYTYCREELQLTRTQQLRLFTEALEKLNEGIEETSYKCSDYSTSSL